jgi:hypothetical protein
MESVPEEPSAIAEPAAEDAVNGAASAPATPDATPSANGAPKADAAKAKPGMSVKTAKGGAGSAAAR